MCGFDLCTTIIIKPFKLCLIEIANGCYISSKLSYFLLSRQKMILLITLLTPRVTNRTRNHNDISVKRLIVIFCKLLGSSRMMSEMMPHLHVDSSPSSELSSSEDASENESVGLVSSGGEISNSSSSSQLTSSSSSFG